MKLLFHFNEVILKQPRSYSSTASMLLFYCIDVTLLLHRCYSSTASMLLFVYIIALLLERFLGTETHFLTVIALLMVEFR